MKLQRIPREPVVRARSSHYHDSCGHWCFRYGCSDGKEDCGECRTKAFNARGGARSLTELRADRARRA
jgi:hypothetical protein